MKHHGLRKCSAALDKRGTLLIHGGLTIDKRALALPAVREALPDDYEPVQGHAIAVADLTGMHADDGECTRWSESGCFHWELSNVQPLRGSVRATGSQPPPRQGRGGADEHRL
ncbi:hypothetical protein [Streptomyces coeruleorubidus]